MHVLRRSVGAHPQSAVVPGRRVRHEQRRQRQDPGAHSVPRGLHSAGVGRQRHGARRGLRRLARGAARRVAGSSWITAYWGPAHSPTTSQSLGDRHVAGCDGLTHGTPRVGGSGGGASPRGSSPTAHRRVVSGSDGMGGARARQSQYRRRPPAGRHPRRHQRQDQVSREVSALRAVGRRRGVGRLLRRRGAGPVHDPGLSRARGQARRRPGSDARRWIGSTADGQRGHQPAVLPAHQGVRGA